MPSSESTDVRKRHNQTERRGIPQKHHGFQRGPPSRLTSDLEKPVRLYESQPMFSCFVLLHHNVILLASLLIATLIVPQAGTWVDSRL